MMRPNLYNIDTIKMNAIVKEQSAYTVWYKVYCRHELLKNKSKMDV